MRVHYRSHSPGHDQGGFTLRDDIRQGVRDQEEGGTSFDPLFLHAPTDLPFTPVVLENIYLFFPRRYVSTLFKWLLCSRNHLESGMNFIFDLAMQ